MLSRRPPAFSRRPHAAETSPNCPLDAAVAACSKRLMTPEARNKLLARIMLVGFAILLLLYIAPAFLIPRR